MTTFLALYRGATVGEAKIVSVSADPDLVAYVANRLLGDTGIADRSSEDTVLEALEQGRKHALRLIAGNTPDLIPHRDQEGSEC